MFSYSNSRIGLGGASKGLIGALAIGAIIAAMSGPAWGYDVVNKGFEGYFRSATGGYNGKIPAGWTPYCYDSNTVPSNMTYVDNTDTTTPYVDSGAHCVEIVPAAGKQGGLYQMVSVTSGQQYTVTCRRRKKGGEAYLGVQFDGSGNLPTNWVTSTNTGIQTYTLSGTATANVITIYLDAWNSSSGGATFDTVTISGSSSSDTTAPTLGGSISPSTTKTTTPIVQIGAQDVSIGLCIDGVQFRWSTDGGATYGQWISPMVLRSQATVGAGKYWYPDFYKPASYTIVSGDKLIYDIWTNNASGPSGSCDLETSSGALRDSGITDQNGLSGHPATNISAQAYHKWYHREFSLTAKAGSSITAFEAAHDGSTASPSDFYVRNVQIVNGSTVKLNAFQPLNPQLAEGVGPGNNGCLNLFLGIDPNPGDTSTPIGCTGFNGTTGSQTISAKTGALVSGSNNRIQFRAFDVNGNVTTSSAFTVTVNTALDNVLNVKRATGIKVDGKPDDWNLGEFTTVTRGGIGETGDYALVGYSGTGCYSAGHYTGGGGAQYPPAGRADHTGRVWSRHDDTYQYFLVRVDDSEVRAPNGTSSNWANDCIEFFIDPSHDGGASAISNSASDIQLVIDAANQKNGYMCTSGYTTQVLNGITSAVVTGTYEGYAGWWLEVQIQKSALDPDMPASGTFGVDFNFRDNDGPAAGSPDTGTNANSSVHCWSDTEVSDSYPTKIPNRWGNAVNGDPTMPNLVLNVKPVTGAITIDGLSGDWNLAEFTTFIYAGTSGSGDKAFIGYDGGTTIYRGGFDTTAVLPTGAADHSATVYSRHDASYQYFLVRIEDSDMRWPNGVDSNWANDCVEFYIDPSHNGGASPLSGETSTSDIQLVFDANNQKNVYMCTSGYRSQVLAGVTSAVVRDSTGWTLEVRIQKSVLDPDLPASGTFGVDFNFRDNDGVAGGSPDVGLPAQTTIYAWRDPFRQGTTPMVPTKIPNNWGDAVHTGCTPPATPGTPLISSITSSGFTVANAAADAGSLITAFRVQTQSGGATVTQWVQAAGTLGGSAVWQTKTTWGNKAVTGLTQGVSYSVSAVAANDTSGTCPSAYSSAVVATPIACSANLAPDGDFEATGKPATWAYVSGGRGTAGTANINFDYTSTLPDGGFSQGLRFWGTNIDIGASATLSGLTVGATYNVKLRSRKVATTASYAEVLVKNSQFTDVDPSGGTLIVKWQTGFGAPDCGMWNGPESAACHTSTASFTATAATMYLMIRAGDNGTNGTDVTFDNLQVCQCAAPPTSVASDRNNFCADDAGSINLSATGGSGTTLRWFTGSCGGTAIGTGTPLTIASPTQTTTYFARWESACGNSTCASTTVTVLPLPVAPTSASSDRNNFCADDAGNINLTATGGSGTTLRWFTDSCGGTAIGTGTPLSIASPTATTTYYARWENSCGNSLCANVTVNVNALPAMPTGASADPATVCSVGGSSTLSASVGAGEEAVWYATPTGGTAFATGSPSVSPTTTTTYYVAARNTTTLCESSSRASVTVNVEPATTYYADADHDTYGNASVTVQACGAPAGYVADSTDCDDTSAAINPAATEVCDTVDNDCDGAIDEGAIGPTWYQDLDGDNYGTTAATQQACVQPVGFAANSTDCDDTDAAINPGATEVCDGVDNDCEGGIDEGVLTTYYHDADSDTYGDQADTTEACTAPANYVDRGGDCNDADAAMFPDNPEVHDGKDNDCDGMTDEGVENAYYRDADGDEYGDPMDITYATAPPEGYVTDNTDCDDGNAAVHPGATEVCNGVDDNCAGGVDEGVTTPFFVDSDADGYGDNSLPTVEACTAPPGYAALGNDCNDADPEMNPGETEVCDSKDNDCDGAVDEEVTTTFYQDYDTDGYGNAAVFQEACTAPSGYVANSTDCDDNNIAVYPGAAELCNTVDDDCDGSVDEGVKLTFYADTDGDNYGDAGSTTQACTAPSGYVTDSTDCDDTRAGVHPGATETCNGLDDDCDNQVDEDVLNTYYEDSDGDTYGNPNSGVQACSPPENFVANNQDCDDTSAAIHPGAAEVCNNVDDNCDGQTDEGVKLTFYADADADGYGNAAVSQEACSAPTGYVADNTDCNDDCATCYPGATEVCDGEDNDCDSAVDEDVKTTFYQDADSDGYGDPAVTTQACSAPTGYVADNTDCNDGDVTAHSLPVAPTSAASDRDNFCADDAGTIDLSVTDGEGTTLRWFTGGCGSTEIGTGSPLTIASPTSTTTYYARWENSCGNSECAEVTVTVMDTPACSIGGPDSVGSGTTNTYDGPAGMNEYLWQITGDGTINGANTEPSVSVTAGTAGSYTLTLTVTTEGGCSSSCELPVAITGITISGTVSFSTGSSAAYPFTRTVKFVVKDGSGGSLATLTQSLSFTNSSGTASASYLLPGLSDAARSISAKTNWHLRKKTTFTPSGGLVTADQTLLGGDLNNSNTVNVLDYAIMAGRWQTTDPVADINGDGQVQLLDYSILKSNWFRSGDAE